jgi:head-tail adaptor
MNYIGEQVRLVTLLKKTVTYNDYNEEVESWAPDTANDATDSNGQLYVEWWDQGGKEVITDGQTVAVEDIRVKTRYIDGLNPREYRIRDGSEDFNIEQPIKRQGRGKSQILMLDRRDSGN